MPRNKQLSPRAAGMNVVSATAWPGESVKATNRRVTTTVEGRPATIPRTSAPKNSVASEQQAMNAPPIIRLDKMCASRVVVIIRSFQIDARRATDATLAAEVTNPNAARQARRAARAQRTLFAVAWLPWLTIIHF